MKSIRHEQAFIVHELGSKITKMLYLEKCQVLGLHGLHLMENSDSIVFILDLGSEVVSHVTHVCDAVLHHQGDVRGHGERHLAGEAAGLGEHGEIPGGECQIDRLLHFDGHGLLLLVHVGGLGELDVPNADVSSRGELDPFLCAGDDDRLSELREISHLGKVC